MTDVSVDDPVIVRPPVAAAAPLVVDSPHSGMRWPADFSPLASRQAILTSWDAFVEELWHGVPEAGGTLVYATFPRAYIDTNRREDDIDPALLSGVWPHALVPSDYSRRGMGLIRRLALPGVPMYSAPLDTAAVEARIAHWYRPYRRAVGEAIAEARRRHGHVVHVNVHSMKSRGNAMNVDAGASRPDIVVSDRRGTTASPALTAWATEWFREAGLRTQVNDPYQGGDLVATFGAPADGCHSVQIEVNRALYMDEAGFTRGTGFVALQGTLGAFSRAMAGDGVALVAMEHR
jgi:N-formylglutamate deformylase